MTVYMVKHLDIQKLTNNYKYDTLRELNNKLTLKSMKQKVNIFGLFIWYRILYFKITRAKLSKTLFYMV